MSAPLPAPRTPGAYRVGLVCLGNICRSPMAHVVLEQRVAEAGLSDRVEVVSSGTGDWHVGKPMDPRAAATLEAAGYDASRHRAQQFADSWHAECDVILVMDGSNHAEVSTSSTDGGGRSTDGGGGSTDERVLLFREFDPEVPGGDVPDPYYGGDDGFAEVMSMVERTCANLVRLLEDVLSP